MCAYLIDYIKSGNDLTHVTEENLTNIYNSEIVRANFETVGYEATHSIDRDEFFEKESQALSIIHEAFKLNEESYIEPQDNTKEHIILTQRNDDLDGDALDARHSCHLALLEPHGRQGMVKAYLRNALVAAVAAVEAQHKVLM